VKNPADDPYHFVFNGIRRMKTLVGEDVVIRPWLQAFPLGVTRGFNARYVQDQIRATRDAGGTGWLMWSPGNHYSEAYAGMEGFRKDAPRPESGPKTQAMNGRQDRPARKRPEKVMGGAAPSQG